MIKDSNLQYDIIVGGAGVIENAHSTHIPSPQSPFKYGNLKCIGRGNFGDVYKATDLTSKTKSLVAIKVTNLDDSSDDIQQIVSEVQFLSKLRHINIIQYIESFVQDYNMFIVMDYCGGGACSELLKYYKRLNESIVAYIIKGVLGGLNYLHTHDVVHRDIKAANILLTETGVIKLADFGVSTELTLTTNKKHTFVGTPFWMAPEVITRGSAYGKVKKLDGYDYKADIWSMGITTIELVNGAPPLAEHEPLKILFEIPKKKPPILRGSKYGENIKDFVKYCLIMEPEKRPSCATLLRHYFITKQVTSTSQQEICEMIKSKNVCFSHRASPKPKHRLGYKDGKTRNGVCASGGDRGLCSRPNPNPNPNLNPNSNSRPGRNNVGEGGKRRSAIEGPRMNDNDMEASLNDATPIEWNFTSTFRQINNGDISPVSEQLLNACEKDSNSVTKQELISIHKYQHLPQPIPPGLIDLRSTSKSLDKGYMLIECLERVLQRGRDEKTRLGVEKLISALCCTEQNHPGLCYALIEEIERALRH